MVKKQFLKDLGHGERDQVLSTRDSWGHPAGERDLEPCWAPVSPNPEHLQVFSCLVQGGTLRAHISTY